jgi:hypothetical protein
MQSLTINNLEVLDQYFCLLLPVACALWGEAQHALLSMTLVTMASCRLNLGSHLATGVQRQQPSTREPLRNSTT